MTNEWWCQTRWGVLSDEWWVMSDENWVMSDGWWKLCDKWPFFLTKQGLNFPPYFDFSAANISFPTPFSPSFFCFCFLLRVPHYVTLPPSFSFFLFIFICLFFFLHHFVSYTPWLPLLFFLPPLSFLFFVHLCTWCLRLFSSFFFFFPYLFLAAPTPHTKLKTLSFCFSLFLTSSSLCHNRRHRLIQPPSPPLRPLPPPHSLFSMVWLLLTWI